MAKKKKSSETTTEKVTVSIYPDEFETVITQIKESGKELLGETLNSRDIRIFFDLKPTHRSGIKTIIRDSVKELSLEQQQELLEQIKEMKEK